jgi:hypothetical protein
MTVGVSQVVEHLLCKREAEFKSQSHQKKKKEEENEDNIMKHSLKEGIKGDILFNVQNYHKETRSCY